LWLDTDSTEKLKCALSTVVVAAYLGFYYYLFSGDIHSFLYYYFAPYCVYCWWLVSVTFLQHHNHDTKVYGEGDWQFVPAAFETIDRTYGYGIDTLSHHITNGHVVHHLFYTKIPHYNLPVATKALKAYLHDNNLDYLYKHEYSYDFFIRVHRYLYEFGFRGVLFKKTSATATTGNKKLD
jgi:omega-3 fatty acid desaturase (delta-15 desaturase)